MRMPLWNAAACRRVGARKLASVRRVVASHRNAKAAASRRTPKKTFVVAGVLIALLFPTIASACPVCFGDPNSAMVKGANNGILVLLGIVVFVQLGLVALFWSFWRRGQALRRRREQFHLISGGVR